MKIDIYKLEELRKEIESLKALEELHKAEFEKLKGIKQTVEAVDKFITMIDWDKESSKEKAEWQKIKSLLGGGE